MSRQVVTGVVSKNIKFVYSKLAIYIPAEWRIAIVTIVEPPSMNDNRGDDYSGLGRNPDDKSSSREAITWSSLTSTTCMPREAQGNHQLERAVARMHGEGRTPRNEYRVEKVI